MTTVISRRFAYISIATVYTLLSAVGTIFLLRDSGDQKKAMSELENKIKAQQQDIGILRQERNANSIRLDWLQDEASIKAMTLEEGIKHVRNAIEEDKARSEQRFELLSQRIDGNYATLEAQLGLIKQTDSTEDQKIEIALKLIRVHYMRLASRLVDTRTTTDKRLVKLAQANLNLAKLVQERTNSFLVRDLNQMYETMIDPTVQISHFNEVGSGTIIYSRNGHSYVLSAAHIINQEHIENEIILKKYDKHGRQSSSYLARIVAIDSEKDLLLLEVETGDQLPTSRFASEQRINDVKVFDRVYAIGCPLGYGPMPTLGEISTKNKTLKVKGPTHWMLNAPTIFGNSGGGIYLADTQEFIGVLSRVSAYNNFVNIAVPHMGILVKPQDIKSWLDEENLQFVYDPSMIRDVCFEKRSGRAKHRRPIEVDEEAMPRPTLEPAGVGNR